MNGLKVYSFLDHPLHINMEVTNKTVTQIDEWIEHSKNNDYELIISFLPGLKNVDKKHFINLQQYVEDQNIKYIDLGNAFNKKNYKNHLYQFDDHLNASGNKIVANYLFQMINQDQKEVIINP